MQDPTADALDPPGHAPSTTTSPAVGLLLATRPRQWVKNLLVVVAPAAAGKFFHLHVLSRTGVALLAFVLASSGTYLLNDARDAEADRLHPAKRTRPIAAGTVALPVAVAAACVLLAGGVGIAMALTWRLGLVVVLYVAQSVLYSMGAKRVAVIELGLVTSGFVLRAVAGGVATGLPLSSWFLVVISFGALFVVVGKRLAELHELGEVRADHRAVLEAYTTRFLESALTMAAGVTVTGYCLWGFAVDRNGLGVHHDQLWIQLSVVPVVLAVLYVLLQLGAGRGGAPEDLVLRDRTVQALGVAWAVLVAVGVYS
ncbi:MAG TPA: decaprenyl-phosphate phosphoribosyltransferase [Acidimicrobiales bacterium]|nr:decaprenyl-phosphate phosphoribosyltransferase [Acidimicrobiales bacterium]